ncbi:MAG: hypothetical protein FVQ83_04305 [Chloroflexi bacterium]|nr:hypothetical protein [Chloroflexota bacterium]
MLLTSPETMRALLFICLFCMLFLAALFLRRRELTFMAYLGWGLLALMLPFIGPYLVIAARPGRPNLI